MKTIRSASMGIVMIFSLIWFAGSFSEAATPKQIYRKAGPGVVFIFASKGSQKGSGGTGSIISKDGLVITNAHLFTQPDTDQLLTDISVFLKPKRVTGDARADLSNGYRGKIMAYDLSLDLALVQILGLDKAPITLEFADSEAVEIGEQVYAIGHPEQGGLWSLTTGVVSAHWRNYGGVPGKHLFQTDASINRGNSGGPLLDQQGSMIGINSMIARKAADGLTITDVNFSIRSRVALDWLEKNGYSFEAVKPQVQVSAEPPKSDGAPAEAEPPLEENTISAPSQPKKKEPPAVTETEPEEEELQPEPPATPKKAEPSTLPPAAEENSAEQLQKKQEKLIAQKPDQKKKPQGGKILTEKNPYRMDDLLEGMREMEDLMDEMKNMIEDFKERSKP